MRAVDDILERLGLDRGSLSGGDLEVRTPITGELLARLARTRRRGHRRGGRACGSRLRAAGATCRRRAAASWSGCSARSCAREGVARRAGHARDRQDRPEGLGEVQEMIDICDLAVGLSRQLFGRTIASERPGHRMLETWHPLGPIAVISAFNFPVAVWSWNAALALVCGDPVVWKPSERTPLTALACQALFRRAAERFGDAPDGLLEVVIGGADRARQLAEDPRLPLVSATGSTAMGKALAPRIAARLGRPLLELGGNNAMIVAPSADLDLAVRAVVFSAVGTAGQRCTTPAPADRARERRRRALGRLERAYASVPVGDPREAGTLCGPLITRDSFERSRRRSARTRRRRRRSAAASACWPTSIPTPTTSSPALVRMPAQTDVVREETFAPILYALTYRELDEAIALHNDVPAGALVVHLHDRPARGRALPLGRGQRLRHRQRQHRPSGAEIGGAFGGEKETGGGRESGSDSWKAYMRRQTATINCSSELPLAQGIVFDVT